MLPQKMYPELQKVIDGELLGLHFLDPKAWNQIGDYMAEVKKRVNDFVTTRDEKDQNLEPLCVSLKELEKEYEDKFTQTKKNEKDEDIIEPRVIRFLAISRARIGKRIHEGTIELGPIKFKSMIWPNDKNREKKEVKKGGTDKGLMNNWAKNGFPID